ncbi:dicarboxylate/amino acid:cation symporter [Paraburkholderia tropica]|uniref:Na+/H+-dicarboxylate symporter n=1 Tax=Paraburkholderia tropica TaxID=92647 RepID=A0A1A5XCM3_9BURK|nr:dicarboxylate/amino acid:cation symporter [Paraburkholderia tropica]MBB3003565.1 Na+/H+-dicarboxylate symporter [Paraburkholderia tropica]MBB6322525.1 Na+/H+-dicarboxylate symporter [Paraburkholderia tropica]MDE1144017.1 dicarboxylate/amino acid:cation symporter [Paraburkholderia tropica]OBR51192.1 C4-dicarboxylate ABC transporter [Paraburkholderia tropica]PXX11486.1 Na+/H+-dicarboxylate symporter [Paraburkholderia tropica]
MKRTKLTGWIVIGMLLGIAVGYGCHRAIDDAQSLKSVADGFALVTDLFLRLIKMIVAPLVFATLVVGVAKMGDAKAVGRVGVRTLAWFLGATFVSLLLGALVANWLQPGAGLNLPLPDSHAATGIQAGAISIREFVTHLVPKSVVQAMAENEILQIVVFAAFFSLGIIAIGEQAKGIVKLLEQISAVMFKVTGYVMAFAPVAVFAALAHVVAIQGLGVLLSYGRFMGVFIGALVLLWCAIVAAGGLVIGGRVFGLVRSVRLPMLLAFSTASSESAYPKLLEQLERSGVPRRISSFVLPLGYSFNLDGSMIYCTFATLFIAQAYGIHLSFMDQAAMLAILMLTSKGMAAVPKASLVVIAATLGQFNIPEAGLLLIMGVDTFLDMGRTATNVLGNSVAAAVVTKWEGQLGPVLSEDEYEALATAREEAHAGAGLVEGVTT